MISIIKFQSLMKDMEMMYSPLSEGQMNIYYERLKMFDDNALEKAVKYLYDTHIYRRFPLIAEIRDAAFKAMGEMPEQTTEDVGDDFECEICHGIGKMVEEITEKDGYFHSVEKFCICPKGERIKAIRKKWLQDKKKKWS